MALEAEVVFLGQLRAATPDRGILVRIVAVHTTHLAAEDRVGVGQLELGLHFQVAGEAGLRGLLGIDDGVVGSPGFDMLAARTVAGLATDVLCVFTLGLELGVIRCCEALGDLVMTLLAGFGTDKCCARNARRRKEGLAARAARY